MSKIAIVTGAGTGVGRRVSEVLSREGIIVYLIGRRKDKLVETQNFCSGNTEVLQCDVSDPLAVEKAFKVVEEKHGRLDVLFNNAGIGVPAQSIDEMPFENWKSVVDINLNGMFLCAKYAFALMRFVIRMAQRNWLRSNKTIDELIQEDEEEINAEDPAQLTLF